MSIAEENTFEEAKLWDLPAVDDDIAVDESQTNALNKPKHKWKYEAPDEVQEVKPLTATEIDAIRDAAYQEGLLSGHEEGFEKGHKEGFEAGKSEGIEASKEEGLAQGLAQAKGQIDEKLDALSLLLDNLHQPNAQINDELKKELVILSTSIANSIVHIEIEKNQDVILQAVNAGIKTLPISESSFQITLNKEDLNLLNSHYGEQVIAEKKWQLIEDDTLSRGGCTIHCASNAVDVSIEKRSQEIIKPILLAQGLIDDPRAK